MKRERVKQFDEYDVRQRRALKFVRLVARRKILSFDQLVELVGQERAKQIRHDLNYMLRGGGYYPGNVIEIERRGGVTFYSPGIACDRFLKERGL